jgi:hypothetical protein
VRSFEERDVEDATWLFAAVPIVTLLVALIVAVQR